MAGISPASLHITSHYSKKQTFIQETDNFKAKTNKPTVSYFIDIQ